MKQAWLNNASWIVIFPSCDVAYDLSVKINKNV